MKPAKFREANRTLLKPSDMTDEECGPLPVYNDGERSISCWKMTWRERLSAFVFGKVWLFVVMGSTQPPVSLMASRTIFIEDQVELAKGVIKKIWWIITRILYWSVLTLAFVGSTFIGSLGWDAYYSNGALQLLFFTNSCIPALMGCILFVLTVVWFDKK